MNIDMDRFTKAIFKFLDRYGIEVIDHYPDDEIVVGRDEDGYAIIAYGVVDSFNEAKRFTITTERFESFLEGSFLERIESEVSDFEKIRYDILLFMPKNAHEGILRYEKDAGYMIKIAR